MPARDPAPWGRQRSVVLYAPHLERPLQLAGKVTHLLFGAFKAVGHKVDGLVLCDGVFLKARDRRVKGLELRLVRQAVRQFAKRRQQTCAKRLQANHRHMRRIASGEAGRGPEPGGAKALTPSRQRMPAPEASLEAAQRAHGTARTHLCLICAPLTFILPFSRHSPNSMVNLERSSKIIRERRSIRFRMPHGAHVWCLTALTKSRKIPARKIFPLFFQMTYQ